MASPPSRAAWIEIRSPWMRLRRMQSPPSRAAWIEISASLLQSLGGDTSPPSRAAWIEIFMPSFLAARTRRRLHGRRGLKCILNPYGEMNYSVAAFTGGVD